MKKIAASPPLGSAERALNRVLNATDISLSQHSENSQEKSSCHENGRAIFVSYILKYNIIYMIYRK